MSDKMDIVDRLTIALEEVSRNRAKYHEYTSESLPQLICNARDAIHELQAQVYAYPPSPPHIPQGSTWRQEYEMLWDLLLKMSAEEFLVWKGIMEIQ